MDKILEVLGSIGFDWKVALANFINFLIVFYLLNKFVFSRLAKTLRERREKIEKGVEDSKRAETALIMAQEKEKQILKEASLKAGEIVTKATHTGNEIVKMAEERGLSEQKNIINKAQVEIDRRNKDAERKVEEAAAEMITDGVKKLLMQKIGENENELLIKRTLKKHKV